MGFGSNSYGALGDGTINKSILPKKICNNKSIKRLDHFFLKLINYFFSIYLGSHTSFYATGLFFLLNLKKIN